MIGLPVASLTKASTSTKFASTRKVSGGCSACGSEGASLRRASQRCGDAHRQDHGTQNSPCHTGIMPPTFVLNTRRSVGRRRKLRLASQPLNPLAASYRYRSLELLPTAAAVYSDVMPLDVAAIQETLRSDGLDGWLLYDFHGSNPIAARLAGLTDGAHMTTRRWYYLIPASGSPRALVHAIERHNLDALPGEQDRRTRTRAAGRGARRRCCAASRRVAMEYSPQGAIPYLSRVDAGTAETDSLARRRDRLVGRSRPALRGRVDAGAARHAPARVRGALSHQGSRVRCARAGRSTTRRAA